MELQIVEFGSSFTAEMFQSIIWETSPGLANLLNLSDDVLVFGRTQRQHDDRLEAVLNGLKQV